MERQAERRAPADPITWYSRGDSHAFAQAVLFTDNGVPAPPRAPHMSPRTEAAAASSSAAGGMAGAAAQQQQSRPGTAAAPWATWGDAEVRCGRRGFGVSGMEQWATTTDSRTAASAAWWHTCPWSTPWQGSEGALGAIGRVLLAHPSWSAVCRYWDARASVSTVF
mgnify:CR=1 FL=1